MYISDPTPGMVGVLYRFPKPHTPGTKKKKAEDVWAKPIPCGKVGTD